MAWYVTSQSEHQEEAWAFLKWLNSEMMAGQTYTRMAAQLAECVGMPCCHAASEHPLYETEWFAPFVQELRTPGHVRAMPPMKGSSEVQEIMHRALETIWFEDADVETTLNQATAEANVILEEYYPE